MLFRSKQRGMVMVLSQKVEKMNDFDRFQDGKMVDSSLFVVFLK